ADRSRPDLVVAGSKDPACNDGHMGRRKPTVHWDRRIVIGSTAAARRAGTRAATAATSAIDTPTAAMGSGPGASTLTGAAFRSGMDATAAKSPAARPMAVNRTARPSTKRDTRPAPEPSATRIANSRIREDARYEITPYVPLSARAIASTANP